MGHTVLFFCRHGEHRSGALVAVFLALVLNICTKEARKMYYKDFQVLACPGVHESRCDGACGGLEGCLGRGG